MFENAGKICFVQILKYDTSKSYKLCRAIFNSATTLQASHIQIDIV